MIFTVSDAAMATSFDCTKAKSLSEHLICSTPELSAADDQLNADAVKARKLVVDQKQFAKELTLQWNWREKNCQDAQCLKDWYARQHEKLAALISSLSGGNITPGATIIPSVPIPTAPAPISKGTPPMSEATWGLRITAADLFSAYRANEVAADMKYKGKRLLVNGTIKEIGVDISGDPFVRLYVPQNPYEGVYMHFPQNAKPTLAGISKGAIIEDQKCLGSGMLIGTPTVNCDPADLRDQVAPTVSDADIDRITNAAILIGRIDALNELCRGSLESAADTDKICSARDTAMTQAKNIGWCWGHRDDAGYQRKWVKCQEGD